MARSHEYHGGLLFRDRQELDLRTFCTTVETALKQRGHHPEHRTFSDDAKARITAQHYAVTLRCECPEGHTGPSCRFGMTLTPADADKHDPLEAMMILRTILLNLAETEAPELLEYLKPEIRFDLQTFLSAFRGTGSKRFATPVQAAMHRTPECAGADGLNPVMLDAQNPYADANLAGRNRNRFLEIAAVGRAKALRHKPIRARRGLRLAWRMLRGWKAAPGMNAATKTTGALAVVAAFFTG